MIKVCPRNNTKENKKIENIIKEGLIKTDKNEYGYMIDTRAVAKANYMGYSLWLINGEIMYESRN